MNDFRTAPDSLAGGSAAQRAMDPDPAAVADSMERAANYDGVVTVTCTDCRWRGSVDADRRYRLLELDGPHGAHVIRLSVAPPSAPSPVPASPKDDPASWGAAQTVAQAAVAHVVARVEPLRSHFGSRSVEADILADAIMRDLELVARQGFEAGAALMRERMESLAAKWLAEAEDTKRNAPPGIEDTPATAYADAQIDCRDELTALCASDAEKREP